jgi:hypothetical protein
MLRDERDEKCEILREKCENIVGREMKYCENGTFSFVACLAGCYHLVVWHLLRGEMK